MSLEGLVRGMHSKSGPKPKMAFSLPFDLHMAILSHPEVPWADVARAALRARVEEMAREAASAADA